MNDVLDIFLLFETSQSSRKRDLIENVEHEELNSVEEIQVDVLVSKQLVQANKEVLHNKRHENLERD